MHDGLVCVYACHVHLVHVKLLCNAAHHVVWPSTRCGEAVEMQYPAADAPGSSDNAVGPSAARLPVIATASEATPTAILHQHTTAAMYFSRQAQRQRRARAAGHACLDVLKCTFKCFATTFLECGGQLCSGQGKRDDDIAGGKVGCWQLA